MEWIMHAIKLSAIGAVALALAAGGTAHRAAAKGVSFNSLTPSQFISSCEKMGGSVSRPGQGTIRCTLPSGTVVDCSFGAGGTVCTWKGDMSTTNVKQLMGDPSPATVNPGSSKTPKAPESPGSSSTVN
jgi:hypothetical protein